MEVYDGSKWYRQDFADVPETSVVAPPRLREGGPSVEDVSELSITRRGRRHAALFESRD
jgi:hypothetical protein